MNQIKGDKIDISELEIEKMFNCYKNGETSLFGSKILKRFELNFSKKFNLNNVLTMPNCTTAIFLALLTLKIIKDDEIIVPNLSHPSAIYPALILGAKIKICDSNKKKYGFDLKHFKTLITKKTRVAIFSHLHGIPSNIDVIREICNKKKIFLIEDVAQGLGVKINSYFAGQFGDFSCFSFGEGKTLVFGEAGACSCKDLDLFNRLKTIRHVGEKFKGTNISSTEEEIVTYDKIIFEGFDYLDTGFNFRPFPPAFQLGILKLKNFKINVLNRKEKYNNFYIKLKDNPHISFLIDENEIANSAPIAIPILLDLKFDREKILLGLLKQGVCVGKFFYPTMLNINSFTKSIINKDENLKNSKEIFDKILLFPTYGNITLDDIDFISDTLNKTLKEYLINPKSDLFSRKHSKFNLNYFDGFFMKY